MSVEIRAEGKPGEVEVAVKRLRLLFDVTPRSSQTFPGISTHLHADLEPRERPGPDPELRAVGARVAVLRAALRCLAAERADEHASKDAEAEYADGQLALAARDLAAATDALPAGQQPAGWSA